MAQIPFVQSTLLCRFPKLRHGYSTRDGGVSPPPFASLNLGPRSGDQTAHIQENRQRFHTALGMADWAAAAPRQVHSSEVTVLRSGDVAAQRLVVEGDGVITDQPRVALSILGADCVPLLLFDPEHAVVAAVHAGWRGTAGGIAAVAVSRMEDAFGCRPSALRVALGPAIGRCCYEVGPEVLNAIAAVTAASEQTLFDRRGEKGMLDLHAANRAQLQAAGVPAANIEALPYCTSCSPTGFFSHRRDGEPTGRGGAVIGMLR